MKVIGDISHNDQLVLKEYTEKSKYILEGGVGGSTQLIGGYKPDDATFITYDTNEDWIKTTKSNFNLLKIPTISTHFNVLSDIDHLTLDLSSLNFKFDFIFVDLVDNLRLPFARAVWPYLKGGGTMAFHDTRRGVDALNAMTVVAEFHYDISNVEVNYNESNITTIRKREAPLYYVDWNIEHNRILWEIGIGKPVSEFYNCKIGVGITTTPERFTHRIYDDIVNKLDPFRDIVVYINNDENKEGVSVSKNKCIKNLYDQGCDYILLLDDDVKIINPLLTDYLIRHSMISGNQHFAYTNDNIGGKILYEDGNVIGYAGCTGVLLFISRQVVEKVGYMDTNFKKYGYEHINYTMRIHDAGLTKYVYPTLKNLNKYIHAYDFDGRYNNESELLNNYTQEEKLEMIHNNDKYWVESNKNRKQYIPYHD